MTPDQVDQKRWAYYPRWKFSHNWSDWDGMRSFCLLSLWASKRGPIGVTLCNFCVEFNPYHKKEDQ